MLTTAFNNASRPALCTVAGDDYPPFHRLPQKDVEYPDN